VVNVPAQYDAYIKQMSVGTGIPYNVIAAQANAESGFDPKAVSSAGAEGWLQFLPSTYDAVASRAGVSPGSEFNPASEAKAYVVYMNDLLKQEGGNLRNTLAAYNAGPGNIAAGYGYADSILKAAGQGNTTVTSGTGSQSTPAQTTGLIPGLSVSKIVQDAIKAFLGMFGLSNLGDMLQRAGIIILGFALVILGIHLLGQAESAKTYVTNQGGGGGGSKRQSAESEGTTTKVTKTAEKGGKGVGATEAVEAAAVA